MRVTLIAKNDVELYDMFGRSKNIPKGCSLLGELNDINGLKLITIVSLDNFFGAVYDESVAKIYFEIEMEDE